MEGFIAKGNVLRQIDNISKGSDRDQKIADFLEALKGSDPDYVGILATHAKLDKADEAHLRQHWFPTNPKVSGWWSEHQPIAPLVRDSLILAFEIAQERGLPVDCYWLCPEGDQFEVSVTWNERQVTRIILTPPTLYESPKQPERYPDDTDGIWVIKKHTSGQPERKLVETRTHPSA
jgi:hypothetical protein